MNTPNQFDVFISFSSKDTNKALEVVNTLQSKHNIRCWICIQAINGGDNYKDRILEAIKEAKVVVLLQSKDSLASKHVAKEISIAFDDDKVIIPFRLDKAEPDNKMRYNLTDIDYIDGTQPTFKERIDELAASIQRNMASSISPPTPQDDDKKARYDVQRTNYGDHAKDNSVEAIEGKLPVLQKDVSRSKSIVGGETTEDSKISRQLHRLRYLIECQNWEEAYKLNEKMKATYSDIPEVFLCSLQCSWRITRWQALGEQPYAFESNPDWLFAYEIASDDLKKEMDSVLQATLDYRKKLAEEAEQKALRKKEQAMAAKRKKEEKIRQKEEEIRQKEEQEKQNRINEAKSILDKAMDQYSVLMQQQISDAQYGQLFHIRNMLESVRDVYNTAEQISVCNREILQITKAAEKMHKEARDVLMCCLQLSEECITYYKIMSDIADNLYYSRITRYTLFPLALCLCLPHFVWAIVRHEDCYTSDLRKRLKKVKWPIGVVGAKGSYYVLADGRTFYFSKFGRKIYIDASELPTIDTKYNWNKNGARIAQLEKNGDVFLLPNGRVCYLGTSDIKEKLNNRQIVACCDYHGHSYALLEDGRILDFNDEKEYRCKVAEEIVRCGISNWQRRAAHSLLLQEERRSKRAFISRKAKEQGNQSIQILKPYLDKETFSG